jgi:hypothetical protein
MLLFGLYSLLPPHLSEMLNYSHSLDQSFMACPSHHAKVEAYLLKQLYKLCNEILSYTCRVISVIVQGLIRLF